MTPLVPVPVTARRSLETMTTRPSSSVTWTGWSSSSSSSSSSYGMSVAKLSCHLAGRHLGLEVRLVDQVGPQNQEHGEAGRHQGDGDDQGGPDGGPGPYGPHFASRR